MICRTTAKEKKPSYGGKQYSLQGASGTASGAAEYTNAYRSSDSILVVHCSSFRERPPGAALSYLEVLPCRWGYVRLFNESAPINFYAVLCRTPQELYDTLENDLAIEKEVQNPQRD